MTQRMPAAIDKLELIRALPPFQHLSDDQQILLSHRLRIRTFTPQERIFEQGDEGDGLYIIAEGHVQVSITSLNGQERIVRILRAGQLLGELALLNQAPRAASALALSRTVTLSLHKDDFNDILNNHPAILVTILLTELAERVRYADSHAEILTDPSIPRRIIRLLLLLAQSNQGENDIGTPAIIEFNQAQLGAMVGTTRETVNRMTRTLQSQGVITVSTQHRRKCIVILDVVRLQQELESYQL